MLAIDLSSLNSSRISCIFSWLLDLLLSLIPCLIDLLADVSHLGLVFSVNLFSSFDEDLELLVFAVDRFFFACFSYSCELQKYFCLFVCDCCRRRRMLLLFKYFTKWNSAEILLKMTFADI